MDKQRIATALRPQPGQEDYVRRRFWPKLTSAIAHIPFADRALAAYYAATDPVTPARAKAVLFAALAYFVLPADLIPDFLLGLGFTDDAAVLYAAIKVLAPHVTQAHQDRALDTLAAAQVSASGPSASSDPG